MVKSRRSYAPNEIAPGREFLHARYLQSDYKTPARCVITSVSAMQVYYRVDIQPGEVTRKPSTFLSREKFPEVVKEWLT